MKMGDFLGGCRRAIEGRVIFNAELRKRKKEKRKKKKKIRVCLCVCEVGLVGGH